MASRGELEDLLHCMICFETYTTPKMLKCAHTFCEDCLQGYLNTYQQQRRAVQGKIPCPTCRELTTLPPNGVPGLRNDFKVQKIEEMFKTVNLRERAASKNCDSCRAQKKHTTCKFYCTNCSMNYCENCFRKHDKNPIFKNHNVIDKTVKASQDLFCKVHLGEGVKFFCKQCETVVCTLCIMHGHDGHTIVEVTKVFSEYQDNIRNLENAVQTKLTRLTDKSSELEKIRHLNLQSCQQAELMIKEKTREVIEAVNKKEAEILEDLQKRRDEKLFAINAELEAVSLQVARACSLQDFASATARKDSLKLMAVHEELIQRMRTVSDLDPSYTDQTVRSVVTFLPGRHEPKLGRIDVVTGTYEELSNNPELAAVLSPRRRLAPSPSIINRKPKQLFAVKKCGSGVGELRDPLGVATLLNGDIVVTEWGNKRLQIFDSVGKPVSIIGSGIIGPQGVTITLKGNIMITDAQHKRLEVFTPSGNSLAKWGLGRFYGPCGVTVCPNGTCVVTDIAEHSVSIYQGEKRCVKRFGSRGTRSDQFDNPLYVAGGHQSEIIVSDSDNHCLKLFDREGRFVRQIGSEGKADGQLKFPRGVCMDVDGNILVADRNNDRVSLFTPKGGFIRHILTREDGIRDPYAVAVTVTRNLVITESGGGRASLKMFQL